MPGPLLCSTLWASGKWKEGPLTAQWSGPDRDESTVLHKPLSSSQTCGYPGFLPTADMLRGWFQRSEAQAPTHRVMLHCRPPWPVMDVTMMPELLEHNSHSLPPPTAWDFERLGSLTLSCLLVFREFRQGTLHLGIATHLQVPTHEHAGSLSSPPPKFP